MFNLKPKQSREAKIAIINGLDLSVINISHDQPSFQKI